MNLSAVSTVLGGQRALGSKLETEMDLVELSGRGIKRAAVTNLAKHLSFSSKQMAELLPVTERTLQRCAPQQRLSPAVSQQVLHIAEVATRGTEVFGGEETFLRWMHEPIIALGGKTPVSLLSTSFGAQMVLNVLGRIEYGVYS